MKVLDVMEKIFEKIKEISGSHSISMSHFTFGVRVNIKLDESQYNELIDMLNYMGYNIHNKEVDEQGLIIDIYHNNHTGEFIAINYMKDKNYTIRTIIYYCDSYEVYP